MRMKLLLIVIGLLIWNINSLFGQSCGTSIANSPTIHYEETSSNKSLSQQICINVMFHIVRNSNGSNAFAIPNTDDVIDHLNLYYKPHDIKFNKIGQNFIDDSDYLTLNTEQSFNDLGTVSFNNNAINFYITQSLNYGSWAGVVMDGIPNKRLYVDIDYLFDNFTSPHEVGHALGLYHTHETDRFGTENINGSNCATAGDLICDTPADPNLEGRVNSNCTYTWGNGYNPLTDNLMSYTNRPCASNFTNEQGERMHEIITNHSVLQGIIGNSCTEISETSKIDYICPSEQKTIHLSYLGSAITTWSTSSNIQVISSNNRSITFELINNNSTQVEGWVKAMLSNGIELVENFEVGLPVYNLAVNFENGATGQSYFLCTDYTGNSYTLNPMNDVNQHQYRIKDTSGSVLYTSSIINGYGYKSSIFYTPSSGFYIFEYRGINDCGTSDWHSTLVEYRSCYNQSGEGIEKSYKIYPNPTFGKLYIQNQDSNYNNSDSYQEMVSPYSIKNEAYEIYDLQFHLITSGNFNNQTELDLSLLKKGSYILKIKSSEREEIHQVIIQ